MHTYLKNTISMPQIYSCGVNDTMVTNHRHKMGNMWSHEQIYELFGVKNTKLGTLQYSGTSREYTLENTEWAIKNGQSRDTDNI